MTCSVAEIASFLGGEVVGEGARPITGVSTPEHAGAGDLAFVTSRRHLARLGDAAAALVPPRLDLPPTLTAVRVADPARAMMRLIDWWFPVTRAFEGVSPAAFVDPTATLGEDVGVGPFAYIGAGATIGAGTEIHPSVSIGRCARVGADCVIHPGVHVYPDCVIGDRVIVHAGAVVGADGFGYVREATGAGDDAEPYRHRKIRHVGRVVIEDDVEIGANTTIDRATFSETRIGRGTKVDNLVTIGHNVHVGRHCIVIGQVGISGSAALGDYVTLAGQVGVADHVSIGDHTVVGAQSGVAQDVKARQVVLGTPAIDAVRAKKAYLLIESLPELKRGLAAHARRLEALERRHAASDGHGTSTEP